MGAGDNLGPGKMVLWFDFGSPQNFAVRRPEKQARERSELCRPAAAMGRRAHLARLKRRRRLAKGIEYRSRNEQRDRERSGADDTVE